MTLHRWAGSKARILPELLAAIAPDPARHGGAVVPFWGSGADGRAFAAAGLPVVAGDSCGDLVAAHVAARDWPDALCATLRGLVGRGRHGYLEARAATWRPSVPLLPAPAAEVVGRGARFLYLVGSSFNGLWRVSRSGDFNVPYGRNFSPDEETIRAAGAATARVFLAARDWRATLDLAAPGDLVYCDPPYLTNFTGYSASGFGPAETSELHARLARLARAGCDVWASNADAPEVFATIEDECEVRRVRARRSIAARGASRGDRSELLLHWPPEVT